MKRNVLEDVTALTKDLLREYYSGNPQPWFERLSGQSVYVGAGGITLFGAKNIKERFEIHVKKEREIIYDEEYFKIPIGSTAAIVAAHVITGKKDDDKFRAMSTYTLVFRLVSGRTKLIYEHVSREYLKDGSPSRSKTFSLNSHVFHFARQLLHDKNNCRRIPIHTGNQTIYVDSDTLLYVKSDGHSCQLHCINKVISCSRMIRSLAEELPEDFYHIHRSYIINVRYLSCMYRYEAELLSGIKIPIPAANYNKVKKELDELLARLNEK